jgi:Tol biopolymer transport system component
MAARTPIPPTAHVADTLIRPGESHLARLWQITFGGENAEGYFSADGRELIWQSTHGDWPCDQMYVMNLETGATHRVSTGRGRTTCGYFYDHDRRVLWASTHAAGDSCPPRPDYSQGYVWPVYADYDIWTTREDGSGLLRLTNSPGYDAEATVSTDGQRIIFTSVRDGDLDLYSMRTDGLGVQRLTHREGYDGGAFYSHDGKSICWRAYYPTDSELVDYRALLARRLVRPTRMNLWVARADGSEARQVTDLAGASFGPYFTPDDRGIIYASNFENPRGRNFDLYVVSVDGGAPDPVTRDPEFDGFPMFSPDGRLLVFASNRGGKERGETNLFLAEWRP